MNIKLFLQGIFKFIMGVLIVGLLIFLPAYTLDYFNGWLLMGLLFIPMFIGGMVLLFINPDLLRRRLDGKEKEKEQQKVQIYSGIMFILEFSLAGFNYRYGWFILPKVIVVIASIFFIIAYLLYAIVLKENAYLLRTITVEKNQKVVDSGLYGIVRHPMYAITLLLFAMMPLILGSLISFTVSLIYPFIIIKRIKNEEKVLLKELPGYKEYTEKVKYKLIPYIW